MTRSDTTNDIKIKMLHAATQNFHEQYPALFQALMKKGNKLQPNTIYSFCGNIRSIKKLVIYTKESDTCIGIFHKHMELLEMIQFPWRTESDAC